MKRNGEHISAIVETHLRPVTMMQVDIEHCDPRKFCAQMLCCNRSVIQITESTCNFWPRMMAGWAA
jgi:hypothetical protein